MRDKKAKPLADRVWVKALEDNDEIKKTKSGIILQDTDVRNKKVWGKVVSVSDGYYSPNGIKIPLSVKVGDEVMYTHGHGEKLELGGQDLLMFKEHELISVVSE